MPLSQHTTLALGGPARFFVTARSVDALMASFAWAKERCPVLVLGGGSNLVIADEGFDGLVIKVALRGVETGDNGLLIAAAGEPWDEVVGSATARGWAGVECLAGIPGTVGATPIQNVGAYGQEVSQVVEHVEALDRATGALVTIDGADCGFEYRNSRFKRAPERHLVTRVAFRLTPDGVPTLAYRELTAAMSSNASPTVQDVRDAVLRLRRRKSMVNDPSDPESRSAGSFFTNPIVGAAVLEHVETVALDRGLVERPDALPRWPMADGRSKIPAAWLIERAGISKGLAHRGVGVSKKHTLALVNRNGGTTAQLLELARRIRDRVREVFGISLEMEPMLVGATL